MSSFFVLQIIQLESIQIGNAGTERSARITSDLATAQRRLIFFSPFRFAINSAKATLEFQSTYFQTGNTGALNQLQSGNAGDPTPADFEMQIRGEW